MLLLQIMQYSIALQAFLSFLEADPETNASVLDADEQRVSDRLMLWALKLLRMGLDGSVLVDVLQDVGLQVQVRPTDADSRIHSTHRSYSTDLSASSSRSADLRPPLACCQDVPGLVHRWRLNLDGTVADELQPKLLDFWQVGRAPS